MPISRCLQLVPRPSASPLFVLLAAAATLFSPAVLCAQALLVEDINTAGTASAGYVGFDEDVAVAGLLHFFSGDDGLTGREPWVLHLDTGVAERLGDLYPGPTSSYPEQFVAIGSSVLFVASSPATGLELWVSDGTPEGTLLVEDIAPGVASSSPYELSAIPSARAVFRADDGAQGTELWVSDGTPGGTMLVDDIAPGSASSTPSQFAVSGGKLYFRANDGTSGFELWTWTTGGVSQVADIEPGAGSSSPSALYAVGTTVVFSACNTADGCELWRSDGTGPGTFQLVDLHPTGSSSPTNFLWHSGLTRLFFVADDGVHGRELWQRSGGVETRVTDISVGLDDSSPTGLGALSASLVFTADDGGGGTRLFGYDGATVSQLKSLSTAGVPNSPRHTLSWNGRIYFNEGLSCWQTDGTAVGTIAFESYCSSSPAFAIGDGRLLYSKSVSGEREIWSIDSAGVKTQETDLSNYSSSPSGFAWLGETAFFSADDAVSGRELWVSDGTPEGTELIDLYSGSGASSPAQFTLFEDEIWFHATTPATGDELWHSDGSAGGTHPYEIIPGNDSSSPSQMVVLGSSLFVVAYDDLLGEQLFRIADAGSPAVLLDFANESYLSPEELITAGNRVYFFGSTAATGQELFSVDEDDIEPTPIEIVPGAGDPDVLTALVAWNGAAYFVADDGITGRQIWRSDGVTAARVTNLSGGYSPEDLTAGPGGLYFVYDDATLGSEVWRTNGVVTQPVTDIDPLAGDAYPAYLTAVGDRLYFRADDNVTGYELWWTDGSQVVQVADLSPGTTGSSPTDLVAAGNRLVFAADDGASGRELWITDGAHVQRLPEAWAGAGASSPTAVAVDPASKRILYSAFGPTTWREPYRIDLRFFADGFESGDSSAWSAVVP